MYYSDLPIGIFNTLLSIWESILETFIEIFSFCTRMTVALGDEDFNLVAVFFGGGLMVYVGFVIARWIKQTFLA